MITIEMSGPLMLAIAILIGTIVASIWAYFLTPRGFWNLGKRP